MGITFSKKNESTQAYDINSSSSLHWNSDSSIDSYKSAVEHDPSLRSFDTILRDRTTSAINSVANSPSFSLDSLRHITSSLADINEQVVKFILQSKEEILHNPELLDLVKEYFDNSSKTLSFYSALKNCLKKIKNNHIFLQLAISRFDKEKSELGENKLFSKTLQELGKFKSAEDPFTEDFFMIFRSIHDQQVSLRSKLEAKKKKLDKKFRRSKGYTMMLNVLFGAAIAVAMICSVVAVVMVAPPVAVALVAASSAPLQEVGKWMSSMWKGYENGVKNELDLVSDMWKGTFTAVEDLKTIEASVDKLKVEINNMLNMARIPIEDDDEVAVTLAINELKKDSERLLKAVNDLEKDSDRYWKDIKNTREIIVNRVKKFQTSS